MYRCVIIICTSEISTCLSSDICTFEISTCFSNDICTLQMSMCSSGDICTLQIIQSHHGSNTVLISRVFACVILMKKAGYAGRKAGALIASLKRVVDALWQR